MRILDNRNIFQKFIDSSQHVSFKSLTSNFIFLILLIGLAATYLEVQHRQDLRQRASTTTINCDVPVWSIDSEESQMTSLINQYRTSKGLSSLSMSSNLNRAAEWKANDLVKTGNLIHSDTLGRTYYQMIYDCGYPPFGVGENLYKTNGGATAQKAFNAWKNSPPHNENLLYAPFKQIGIARVSGGGFYYWTSEFGEGNDGTDGSYEPSATLGPPKVISATPSCRSDGQIVVTFNFTPGANAIYHELIYNVGSTWDPNGTKVTITDGQVVPSPGANGFSANLQLNYNIQACDVNGTCKLDPNGYYSINTGPSCSSSSISTPTPTSSLSGSTPTPTMTPTPTLKPTLTPTLTPTMTPTSTPIPTPNIISCGSTTCNGSTQVCLSDYYTGASTCCAKGYTYVCNGTCTTSPCPTPTPTNCSPCTSSSKNYCVSSTQIGICSDGCYRTYTCAGTGYKCVSDSTQGAICVSSTSAPTPTPTPAPQICSPYSWCGSMCLSPCYTSDLYCNSTGTACNVQVGSYYGNYCGCTAFSIPTPTPAPVQVCSPYSWCGSMCISPCYTSDLYCNSTGTACNVQVGSYYGNWCGCY